MMAASAKIVAAMFAVLSSPDRVCVVFVVGVGEDSEVEAVG